MICQLFFIYGSTLIEREYYRHAGHGHGLSGNHGLKGFSSIKAASVGIRDNDYGDYYEDEDYYDYDYSTEKNRYSQCKLKNICVS